jgi:hypothetical protein
MGQMGSTIVKQAAFRGNIGMSRFDITPPPGIYSRMWGAARNDTASGIHRPLAGTALTFSSVGGSNLLVLVSLDLGWWRTAEEEWFVRGHVLKELRLGSDQLLIALSHTHSGPSMSLTHAGRPGGAFIEPYLKKLRSSIVSAVETARNSAGLASLAWATGTCKLAGNRIYSSHVSRRPVVGYNPSVAADDNLLVGRITTHSGKTAATIVNYACHPTTLGPANRLISPDYVGAMRELVEDCTDGAPCLFMQGASGELAPMQQYTDDTSIADQNGRVLGHAAMSTLDSMLPHNADYCFSDVIESGATLGVWRYASAKTSEHLEATQISVDLPIKATGPLALPLKSKVDFEAIVVHERLERSHQLRQLVLNQNALSMPVWSWRLGDSLLVGAPAECFSDFQIKLRARHQDKSVAIVTNANGYFGYIPSLSYYRDESYEVQVSLFAAGCLEKLTEAVDRIISTGSHASANGGAPRPHFPMHDTAVTNRS